MIVAIPATIRADSLSCIPRLVCTKGLLRRPTRMKLCDIVVTEAILPSMTSSKREDAIGELLDALVEADALDEGHRESYKRAILSREKKGSTGFGHGVAVPHVKSPTIDTLKVAIGNSEGGVEFNALDKQPVYSIFLLLSPEESPEDHIDAMEAIFGNLSKDQFRKFLRQATSVEEIVVLLQEADSGQTVR